MLNPVGNITAAMQNRITEKQTRVVKIAAMDLHSDDHAVT